jgi:hypothetical protein
MPRSEAGAAPKKPSAQPVTDILIACYHIVRDRVAYQDSPLGGQESIHRLTTAAHIELGPHGTTVRIRHELAPQHTGEPGQ